MSKPTLRHYDYALQIIDYLNTTKDLVMTYKAPPGTATLTFDMFATTAPTGSNINLDHHAPNHSRSAILLWRTVNQ